MREFVFTARFERLFKKLPKATREETYEKLALFLNDPAHTSPRVKRIKRTVDIWEMSITMSYRVTFQFDGELVVLRRIGTHDLLRQP